MKTVERAAILLVALLITGCGGQAPTLEPTSQGGQGSLAVASPGGISAPFAAGITAQVIHGYNDPLPTEPCVIGTARDHCQNQRDGLDFGLPAGSDVQILAPTDGVVTLELPMAAPGPDGSHPTGPCLLMTSADGYNINLCHFGTWAVGVGQPVQRGCVLGTRDTNWIHMSIDDRFRDSSQPAVAFVGAHALEGEDYPEKAATIRDQYGPGDTAVSVTSTNAARKCESTVSSAPASPVSPTGPAPTAESQPTQGPGPANLGPWAVAPLSAIASPYEGTPVPAGYRRLNLAFSIRNATEAVQAFGVSPAFPAQPGENQKANDLKAAATAQGGFTYGGGSILFYGDFAGSGDSVFVPPGATIPAYATIDVAKNAQDIRIVLTFPFDAQGQQCPGGVCSLEVPLEAFPENAPTLTFTPPPEALSLGERFAQGSRSVSISAPKCDAKGGTYTVQFELTLTNDYGYAFSDAFPFVEVIDSAGMVWTRTDTSGAHPASGWTGAVPPGGSTKQSWYFPAPSSSALRCAAAAGPASGHLWATVTFQAFRDPATGARVDDPTVGLFDLGVPVK